MLESSIIFHEIVQFYDNFSLYCSDFMFYPMSFALMKANYSAWFDKHALFLRGWRIFQFDIGDILI